jgi:nucleoside-diphosphate-sugar epimerase
VGHVFHLAAKTYVPESWQSPPDFYAVNVLGTAMVMEFCRRQGASVTLCSSYVYGRPVKLPVSEDHPLSPFNPYSHSKILAEELARYYETAFGVPLTIVRPFNLYGPGQAPGFLIPTLLQQAISADHPEISVADDRPRRDFLFISDFVELLSRLAASPRSGTFNAGSGASTSIRELVSAINSLLETPKRLVCRGDPRPDEVFDMFADVSRADHCLGWRPKTGLLEGLRRTFDSMSDTEDRGVRNG